MTTSSGQQTQQQSSVSSPWQPTQGALTNVIGNLQGTNTATTPAENSAIQQLLNNSGQVPQGLGNQLSGSVQSLLSGIPNLNQNLNQSQQQAQGALQPYLSSSYLNPASNPQESQLINAITQQTMNSVGGQFAGAGRANSPGMAFAESQGLAQGLAPTLFNQYNQNVQNQQGAANSLSGMANQYNNSFLGNLASGVGNASNISGLNNLGPLASLAASNLGFSLPLSQQGQVLSQLLPIAGLGGQTNSQGSGTSQQTASPVSALGSLFGGQYSPISGMANAAGGILGGLYSFLPGQGGFAP